MIQLFYVDKLVSFSALTLLVRSYDL